MTTSDRLQALLRSGQLQDVVAFFAGMEESERRKHAPQAIAALEAHGDAMSGSDLECARVAVLASANLTEIKKLGRRNTWLDGDIAFEVLSDRRPKQLSSYLEWLLDVSFRHWRQVRRFVREGLCEPPGTPLYVLGMIDGAHQRDLTLAESLLRDPELLDELCWRLFEHEGGGELSLAAHDKYCAPERSWSTALCALAAQGHLDRKRLLRASLDALSRDFAQFRAGWFSRFHDALEPTSAERAELADAYLALLSSSIPPTVSMALRHVEQLWREQRIAPDRLVPRLQPMLFAKSKSTALDAIELLAAAAARAPALALTVARTVASALEHPHADVQRRAFEHLRNQPKEHGDALREAASAHLDHVAPALRATLAAWLGTTDERPEPPAARAPAPSTTDLRVPAWARVCAGLDAPGEDLWGPTLPTGVVPRLVEREALHVPESVESAIELLERALAAPGEIDLVERAIAGVAANPFDRSDPDLARRIGPLRKQLARLDAREQRKHVVAEPSGALRMVAEAWLDGRMPEGFELDQGFSQHGISAIFLQRMLDLCPLVARGESTTLLSTPSHEDGWLSAAALCARIHAGRMLDSEADRVLALLRLAPDGRAAALETAQGLAGELGAALRYALGAEQAPEPGSAALWVAAARARAPHADDAVLARRYRELGPGGAHAARLDFAVSKRTSKGFSWHIVDIVCEPQSKLPAPAYVGIVRQPREALPFAPWHLLPSVLCYDVPRSPHGFSSEGPMGSAWSASLWPQNVDPLLVHAALESAPNLDAKRPGSRPRPAGFDALFDPDLALTPMGQLLIALALTASDEGDGQVAIDACIDACASARLDPRELGRTMQRLYFTGIVKPTRWAKRLTVVSRHSALTTLFVRDALFGCFLGDSELPRDSHALVELLRDCCIESGSAVGPEETRALLARVQGSSALAKAARTALALEPDAAKAARVEGAARNELRTGRERAAQRWAQASV